MMTSVIDRSNKGSDPMETWADPNIESVSAKSPDEPDQAQQLYRVEVKQQGNHVAYHDVAATDALAAINLVEILYTDPVLLKDSLVEDDGGRLHHILIASNWHGYTFNAHTISDQ